MVNLKNKLKHFAWKKCEFPKKFESTTPDF